MKIGWGWGGGRHGAGGGKISFLASAELERKGREWRLRRARALCRKMEGISVERAKG